MSKSKRARISTSLTALSIAGAVCVSGAGIAYATPVSSDTTSSIISDVASSLYVDTELNTSDIYSAFSIIESIPDEALQSEEAFEAWKRTQEVNSATTYASVGACAAGITLAVITNFFVISKIAKLKSVIKAAGGAKAAATKAINAYKKARAAGKSKSAAITAASNALAVNGGSAVRDLLLDLFSIQGVIDGCFN